MLVGFAAEHGPAGLARARAKRERKRLDLIVHNDVSVDGHRASARGENEITIIGPDGEETLPRMSKEACAEPHPRRGAAPCCRDGSDRAAGLGGRRDGLPSTL